MRGLAAMAALVGACTFDSSIDSGSGDVADTTGESSTSAATTGSSSATGVMSSSTTTTTTTSDTSESGEVEEESGEPVEYPASCLEIRMENAGAASGRYEIAPPMAVLPTPMLVYCDMETDSGGWTLVGRSVAGESDPGEFGWGAARGDITDPSVPYSLNVKAAGLKFTQVLVGEQGIAYAWGGHVYRFDVLSGFLGLDDDSTQTIALTTIAGDCDGPDMLDNAGYTADTQVFWLRDQTGFERFGLLHNGFDMWDTGSKIAPCDHGADLHDQQGMVMVR